MDRDGAVNNSHAGLPRDCRCHVLQTRRLCTYLAIEEWVVCNSLSQPGPAGAAHGIGSCHTSLTVEGWNRQLYAPIQCRMFTK